MAAIPSDLDNEARPEKWLFAPHGYPIHYVQTRGWQSQELKFDKDGTIIGTECDQFPEMQAFETPGGDIVLDDDYNDFLVDHCRIVEVYEGFTRWDYDSTTEPAIEPWPDHIVKACMRVATLQTVAANIGEARGWLPREYSDDFPFNAAIDNIVLGRLKGEIAALEAEIAEFRKGRVEPTRLEEDDVQPATDHAEA